jgi:hypothetical protein
VRARCSAQASQSAVESTDPDRIVWRLHLLTIATVFLVLLVGAASDGPASLSKAYAATETETEIPCEGDTCQPLPVPPEDPQPGTAGVGPANPPPHYGKPASPHKPKHRRHKHHHHRKTGKR